MAKLFLSYVREDQERARALAKLIERAGHSVWWDRHIKGGAQFALEIVTATSRALRLACLPARELPNAIPWMNCASLLPTNCGSALTPG